jgi:hypothetical protein
MGHNLIYRLREAKYTYRYYTSFTSSLDATQTICLRYRAHVNECWVENLTRLFTICERAVTLRLQVITHATPRSSFFLRSTQVLHRMDKESDNQMKPFVQECRKTLPWDTRFIISDDGLTPPEFKTECSVVWLNCILFFGKTLLRGRTEHVNISGNRDITRKINKKKKGKTI